MSESGLRQGPDRVRLLRPLGLAALALSVGVPVPAGSQTTPAPLPPLPLESFTLDNGLRVVVSEDRSTPVVAVSVWYHVGSAHEFEGRTGLAHLVEHLFFDRTENLEAGEAGRSVSEAGGVFDGTTSRDRTALREVVPAERLNLALWLQAERMSRLRFDGETLAGPRRVVEEERRLRVERSPYGRARLVLDTLSAVYEPYRHPVLGAEADLRAVSVDDVREVYRSWYGPSSAVLVVVGDATAEEVRELVEEYFGGLEAAGRGPELPEPPPVPRIGAAGGERRRVLEDPRAPAPLIQVAYSTPPARHPDRHALDLLAEVLGGGGSDGLVRETVHEAGAAREVTSAIEWRVGPGVLRVVAVPVPGVSTERLESLLEDRIARIRNEGITRGALERALVRRRSELVRERLTVRDRAEAIQRAVLHHGTPDRVNDDLARYEAVTVEDVRRVAATYLVPSNRTVVVALPSGGGGA